MHSKMKRRLAYAASSFMLALSLAACGGGSSNVGAQDAPPDAPVITSLTQSVPTDVQIASPFKRSATASISRGLMRMLNSEVQLSQSDTGEDFESHRQAVEDINNCTTVDCCMSSEKSPDKSESTVGCYGPSVTLNGDHPDAASYDHPIPSGDLGIWDASESGTGEACLAAKMNSKIKGVQGMYDFGLLRMAQMVCVARLSGISTPAVGESVDITSTLSSVFTAHEAPITFSSVVMSRTNESTMNFSMAASMSNSGGGQQQQQQQQQERDGGGGGGGGGTNIAEQCSAQGITGDSPFNEVNGGKLCTCFGIDNGSCQTQLAPCLTAHAATLQACYDMIQQSSESPAVETDNSFSINMNITQQVTGTNTYKGFFRLILGGGGSSFRGAGGNCPNDTTATNVMSIGYEKLESETRIKQVKAVECGDLSADQIVSGYLDADGYPDLNKKFSNVTGEESLGWSDDYNMMIANLDSAGLGSITYGWMAGKGDNYFRMMNGRSSSSSASGYFGFQHEDTIPTQGFGRIQGMVCNWAGPGGLGGGSSTVNYVQYQAMTYDSASHIYADDSANSHLSYAPTFSCENHTTSMLCNGTACPTENHLLSLSEMSFSLPSDPVGIE